MNLTLDKDKMNFMKSKMETTRNDGLRVLVVRSYKHHDFKDTLSLNYNFLIKIVIKSNKCR